MSESSSRTVQGQATIVTSRIICIGRIRTWILQGLRALTLTKKDQAGQRKNHTLTIASEILSMAAVELGKSTAPNICKKEIETKPT